MGLEPIRRIVSILRAVLAATVVSVGPDPPLQRARAELATVDLEQIAPRFARETFAEKGLVHLFD
jgi:hypothetical protein